MHDDSIDLYARRLSTYIGDCRICQTYIQHPSTRQLFDYLECNSDPSSRIDVPPSRLLFLDLPEGLNHITILCNL